MKTEVLSEELREAYLYRKEIWTTGGNPPREMEAAYSPDGKLYIGPPTEADWLADERGIREWDTCREGGAVANVGFSPGQQKWFGWSHRAIFGFGVGHEIKEGDSRESLPVGFKAETLEDAKKIAADFAESVS